MTVTHKRAEILSRGPCDVFGFSSRRLAEPYRQATQYLPGLPDEELPAYFLVSDFENLHLYKLSEHSPPAAIVRGAGDRKNQFPPESSPPHASITLRVNCSK